jgi:hypothetical protein
LFFGQLLVWQHDRIAACIKHVHPSLSNLGQLVKLAAICRWLRILEYR